MPREDTARHNRYLITPQDMLAGEIEADRLGLDVVGVFHSHPDHPNLPSEFDREWALPWFSYLITSVIAGEGGWQPLLAAIRGPRKVFTEEKIRDEHQHSWRLNPDDNPKNSYPAAPVCRRR